MIELFTLVDTKEQKHPSSRYGHSSIHYENKGNLIIIFGGCDSKAKFCKDLWIFNIEQNKWHDISTPFSPEGRNFHSSVIYKDDLYIFAGTSNGLYSDLYKFNLGKTKFFFFIKKKNNIYFWDLHSNHLVLDF